MFRDSGNGTSCITSAGPPCFALSFPRPQVLKPSLPQPRPSGSSCPGPPPADLPLAVRAMAPHLSAAELDVVRQCVAKKMLAQGILNIIAKARKKAHVDAPQIWAIRRAMAGVTHRRGMPETRGRRKKLTAAQAERLFRKRGDLISRAGGEQYVPLREVRRTARVPQIHDTTAARYLRNLGVSWRRMREKPPRTEAHEDTRKAVCDIWRKRPASFWTDSVDLIIDAKKFPLPGNDAAARRLRQQRVRGVLRTRQEGLQPGFTKPSIVKHKFNFGGHANILAGICGDRVVLWEEIHGRWCGQRAEEMYAGPIKKVVERLRPGKRSWLIMEDNDPSGFKSARGLRAKVANRLKTVSQPPYSPDLNPLDFSLWSAIQSKALATRPKKEKAQTYKARLRKIALSMPRAAVKKAVQSIRARAQAIFDAEGGNIKED